MLADKHTPDIPDKVIESLARTILPSIRKYFESEKGQKEFTEWKRQSASKAAEMAEAVKPE